MKLIMTDRLNMILPPGMSAGQYMMELAAPHEHKHRVMMAKNFGGGGSSSPEQVQRYTPEQQQLLSAVIGQILPQVGQGITPYAGQRVAGITPSQEMAFSLAPEYAPGIQAGMQGFSQFDPSQGQEFLGQGAQTLQTALQPFDPAAATDFWETSFKRPALETWRQDIMPAIMEKGVRSAGTADSGPMQRELAQSGETLATNLSAQLGNLLYSGQQSQMGRQIQSAGMLGQMSQMPGQLASQGQQLAALGLGQMGGMGAEQRGIGQQFLGAEQQKWMEGQPYMNPWLQQFLPTLLGASSFDTVIGQEGPSMASELAPYAMAAALAFGSDVRIKENIKPITGALDKVKKLAGYSYNYKFNVPGNRNGGVMAQDVERVLPDAVSEIDGVKFVRYDAVVALLVEAVKELHQKILRSN